MREVNKGTKVPFHGYLLNMGEYEKYSQYIAFIERYRDLLENGFFDKPLYS